MGWLKKQIGNIKASAKDEWRHREELRREEKISRRQEEKKQASLIGKKKAQIKANEQLKRYKERQKPKSYEFKGFAGPTKSRPNVGLGMAEYLTGGTPRKTTKKKGFDDMRLF